MSKIVTTNCPERASEPLFEIVTLNPTTSKPLRKKRQLYPLLLIVCTLTMLIEDESEPKTGKHTNKFTDKKRKINKIIKSLFEIKLAIF